MIYHSCRHTIRGRPPPGEVYSPVTYTNGEQQWLSSGSNRNYNSTHMDSDMVMFHNVAKTVQHAKTAIGKIFLYINGSIIDHGHLRTNVVWISWLSLVFDIAISCFMSPSRSKLSEVLRLRLRDVTERFPEVTKCGIAGAAPCQKQGRHQCTLIRMGGSLWPES